MIKEEKLPHPCLQLQILFACVTPVIHLLQKQKGHILIDAMPAAEKAKQTYLYEIQQQHSCFSLPETDFQWQPLSTSVSTVH